jgi:hypothetical protein
MRHRFCIAMLMLSLLVLSEAARGEVQQAAGWHAPTDNGDRYNGAGAPSTSPMASDAAAWPSGNYGSTNRQWQAPRRRMRA